MKLHPQDLTLQELVESLGTPNRSLFQHILTCPSCLERARALFAVSPVQLPGLGNVVPLDRWLSAAKACSSPPSRLEEIQVAFERERDQAERLVLELLRHPFERRRLLAMNQQRFHTWGVCDELLNRSWDLNFSDAPEGERLAELATEVGDRLDGSRYGGERVEDLRARAWAYLGNSRRILANLEGAETAFDRAMVHLKDGTGEPMERAMVLELRSSLYRAQRRFEEALRALRRAITTFRELGEGHRAGRALLAMALLYKTQGEAERAIPLVYEAIDLIEPDREPRLVFSAWHGLIDNLADLGRFLEAHKLSTQARPILQAFSEPWALNPRKWVEAKISHGLGQADQAEAQYLAALRGFLAEQTPYEVALVSLDLGALYLQQGRNDDARRVAEQALPIFTSRNIQREALGAFIYWQQAVSAGTAQAELASSVAQFLKRARHNPALRFEPPAGSNQ